MSKNPNRLQRAWLEFEARSISPEASPRQRQMLRRVFYSGAMATLSVIVADLDPTTEEATDDDVLVVQQLDEELRQYFVSQKACEVRNDALGKE